MSVGKYEEISYCRAIEAVGVLLNYRATFRKDQANRFDLQRRGLVPEGVAGEAEAEEQLARHKELEPMIEKLGEHAEAIGRLFENGLDYRKY